MTGFPEARLEPRHVGDPVLVPATDVPWLDLLDPAEHRLGCNHRPEGERLVQTHGIQLTTQARFSGEQGLRLTREDHPSFSLGVVEGRDSEGIARKPEPTAERIPDGR